MSDLIKQFEAIDQKLDKTLTGISEAKTQATTLETKMATVEGAVNGVKGQVDTIEKSVKDVETNLKGEIKVVADEVDKIKADSAKKINSPANKQKSFNEILGETIEENKHVIQNYTKEQGLVGLKMQSEEQAEIKGVKDAFKVKAVGDMSISANFTDAPNFTRDVRSNLIETPYNRLWLADILPGGNSTGTSVLYPKENGGEGGAAAWTDPTADKAQMDFDLTSASAYFKWIAGYVIVAREMLDDITFLTSYLQNKMLISLKTAENGLILDGTGDSNPVQGLNDVATAYDGAFTVPVDRIIDAAYGQIVEDTEEQYQPTHTILTPRDAVSIGLNKSAGSQEYDLPNGSVAFQNGRLQLGGLQNVTTTLVGTGNFIALDARATMFIRRMLPELRIFEDATLAKKNKIMFRIEERATLITFNNNAIVKGTLEPAA